MAPHVHVRSDFLVPQLSTSTEQHGHGRPILHDVSFPLVSASRVVVVPVSALSLSLSCHKTRPAIATLMLNMNNSHSSTAASAVIAVPQHLLYDAEMTATTPPSVRSARTRATKSTAMALALPLLLVTAPGGLALSLSPTTKAGPSRSLVDQARMIRELKSGSAESQRAQKMLTMDPTPLLDNDALSAALFDDDFVNSLESAVANLKKKNSKKNGEINRAEEFDRFMEEDATVASIVQENIRPGSLVDEVQQNKGADIVNMEALLQKEAADRRKSRNQVTSSSPSSVKVIRKTKLASQPPLPVSPKQTSPRKSNALLTRDQEYALAYTIQAGTRVHKLKAEYESSKAQSLSKKQWAELAGMSPNELRKLISDYRTAKQELVSCNMGLVHAVCKTYTRKAKYRGVPVEELIQEGSLGLIRAAELFDPEKGLRFSTYGTIWIKGVLSNSNLLEEVIKLPNRERVLWNKVRAAWEEMGVENGDDSRSRMGKPTLSAAKEIAKRLDMKQPIVEDHLRRMACVTNVLSLDYKYAAATRSGYADNSNKQEALLNSARFDTDADLAEKAQFKADVVASLVRNLTEREVTLMRLRYGLEDGKEYTIKECASKMGINRETARLLQHKCLKKLREASNMESLQEYLLTVA